MVSILNRSLKKKNSLGICFGLIGISLSLKNSSFSDSACASVNRLYPRGRLTLGGSRKAEAAAVSRTVVSMSLKAPSRLFGRIVSSASDRAAAEGNGTNSK